MSNHQQQHIDAMHTRQLTPADDLDTCPLAVAGEQHTDEPCFICTEYASLLDHARIWRRMDGRIIYTAEPYEATALEIAELNADLCRYQLRVTITGDSPWNPGSTFRITVTEDTPTPKKEIQ